MELPPATTERLQIAVEPDGTSQATVVERTLVVSLRRWWWDRPEPGSRCSSGPGAVRYYREIGIWPGEAE